MYVDICTNSFRKLIVFCIIIKKPFETQSTKNVLYTVFLVIKQILKIKLFFLFFPFLLIFVSVSGGCFVFLFKFIYDKNHLS